MTKETYDSLEAAFENMKAHPEMWPDLHLEKSNETNLCGEVVMRRWAICTAQRQEVARTTQGILPVHFTDLLAELMVEAYTKAKKEALASLSEVRP